MSELTIVTPFGPGFSAARKLWPMALDAVGAPKDSKVLLIDDSKGSVNIPLLAESTIAQGYQVEWRKMQRTEETEQAFERNRALAITARLIEIWRFFLTLVGTEYILSLEHDIIPPEGTYERLKETLTENPKAGCVAIACRHRLYLHYMAYALASLDPYELGPTIDHATCDSVCQVGGVHTGCTLFRTEALKAVKPRSLAPGSYAHEHAIAYDLIHAGWSVWTDNRQPHARHYLNETAYV